MEQDIGVFFDKCGSIRDVRVIRTADRTSKGFGYVEFEVLVRSMTFPASPK